MTSGKFVTSLGYERLYNNALSLEKRESFINYMNQGQPVRPANINNIIAINQGRRPLTMDSPQAKPLKVSAVQKLMSAGHVVIDTRSTAAFCAGHIPDALNIQLAESEFEQRVGWIAAADHPLILITDSAAEAERAANALAFLGLDQQLAGCLEGGISAWIDAGLPYVTLPQITVHQLEARLNQTSGVQLLDVRDSSEWDDGHIVAAVYMNYKELPAQLPDLALDKQLPTAVICGGGVRSSIACSILLRNGFQDVLNVTGGMGAWSAAGKSMVDASGTTYCRR